MPPLDTSSRGVGASVTFSIRDFLKKSTYVHEKVQKKYKKYNLAFICSVVWHPVLTRFFIVLIQHNTSDNLPYEKVGNSDPVCIANEVPFLSVQNISSGKFDLTKIKYITQEEHQKSTLLFPISQGTPPDIARNVFCITKHILPGKPPKTPYL